MPGTTAKAQIPYPLPTEPVRDGAVAMKNMADRIDDFYGYRIQAGQTIVTTDPWGGFRIPLPVGPGQFASVLFGDGDTSNSGWYLIGAKARVNPDPWIDGQARHVTTPTNWAASVTIRVNFLVYG